MFSNKSDDHSPREGLCLHIECRQGGRQEEKAITAALVGNQYYVMMWSMGGSTVERTREAKSSWDKKTTTESSRFVECLFFWDMYALFSTYLTQMILN